MKTCGGEGILYAKQLWTPKFGPLCTDSGCRFRLLAKSGVRIDLILQSSGESASRCPDPIPMELQDSGLYEVTVPNAGVGTRYSFSIDGQGPFPDPASRYQPQGVHGFSQVVDEHDYRW